MPWFTPKFAIAQIGFLLAGFPLLGQAISETWSDQDSLFKEGVMITTDSGDNTIATSFIWLDDIYTKKYAPDGTLLWEAVSSGPTFSVFERPYWVHADASDNVIVVGEKYILSSGSNRNTGMVVIKYDPSGNELWKRSYDGVFSTMRSHVDASGNIYLASAGQFTGDAQFGAVLRKLDPGGNILWTRYKYFGGLYFRLHAMQANADEDRFLLVSSNTYPIPSPANVVFDDNGNEIWSATSTGAYPSSAVFDDAGNAYVSYGSADYNVSKYDPAGGLVWTRSFDFGGINELPMRMVTNALGHLVITGKNGLFRLNTLAIDTAGNEIWRTELPDLSTGIYSAFIDADQDGNVYISGAFADSATFFTTIKYDSDGQEVWRDMRPGNRAVAVAVGQNKSIHVVGWYGMMVVRYDQLSCAPPDSMAAVNLTPSSVKLQWSPVPDAYGYEIWGKRATDPVWRKKRVPGFKVSQNIPVLTACTDYVTKIRTICDSASLSLSDFTPEIAFTTPGCRTASLSASEAELFPNPAVDHVFVRFSEALAGTVRVEVHDLAGRPVYRTTLEDPVSGQVHRIPLMGLAQGSYVVRLWTGNAVLQRSLLHVAP